jgi:hypothetical protein
MWLAAENQRTQRKTCSSATSSHTNPTWSHLGLNPDLFKLYIRSSQEIRGLDLGTATLNVLSLISSVQNGGKWKTGCVQVECGNVLTVLLMHMVDKWNTIVLKLYGIVLQVKRNEYENYNSGFQRKLLSFCYWWSSQWTMHLVITYISVSLGSTGCSFPSEVAPNLSTCN